MLTLCIALHLYAGSIDSHASVTELSNECKSVKVDAARKAIAKCAKQGAEKCEVIISKDKKVITLEHKIAVKGE